MRKIFCSIASSYSPTALAPSLSGGLIGKSCTRQLFYLLVRRFGCCKHFVSNLFFVYLFVYNSSSSGGGGWHGSATMTRTELSSPTTRVPLWEPQNICSSQPVCETVLNLYARKVSTYVWFTMHYPRPICERAAVGGWMVGERAREPTPAHSTTTS